jgi:hypothetical protein
MTWWEWFLVGWSVFFVACLAMFAWEIPRSSRMVGDRLVSQKEYEAMPESEREFEERVAAARRALAADDHAVAEYLMGETG